MERRRPLARHRARHRGRDFRRILFSAFGMEGITGLNIWSMIVAIIGSIVVLWGYHALVVRR